MLCAAVVFQLVLMLIFVDATSSSESVSISELAMESKDVLKWFCACFVKRRVGGGVRGLHFGRCVS